MGILDKLKSIIQKPEVKIVPPTKKKSVTRTEKQIATEKGLPWVGVLSVDLDPDNVGNGAFELDWNDKFITNLVRAGYEGKTDSDMVDRWFAEICRNVVAENYEQWEANQPINARPRIIDLKDLGDGKIEVS